MKRLRKWKKTALFLTAALLIGTVDAASGSKVVQASSSTRHEIDMTQKDIDRLEGELDKNQDTLTGLKGTQNSLQKELDNLNSQMTAIAENLADLEQQMCDKDQEITETQRVLDEAREREEWQRDSMVTMMRYMYEMQEDNYLSALLSSNSFGDLLNKAANIEKVMAYSQQKMREYKENRRLIEEQEAKLQQEMADLEELQAQAQEEKNKVSGLIQQTAASIAQYADEIEEAERKAREYEEEIKRKEADLKTLQKKLADEIAMSQAAANGVWRDISEIEFTEQDRYLLANLIYCEAGAEPYEGQVAVGSVVINRVLSSKFPNTIEGVIYQNRQFSPVASGRLALALSTNRATERCYRAADEAMAGVTTVGNCVYFRTPIEGLTGISIGGHIFY